MISKPSKAFSTSVILRELQTRHSQSLSEVAIANQMPGAAGFCPAPRGMRPDMTITRVRHHFSISSVALSAGQGPRRPLLVFTTAKQSGWTVLSLDSEQPAADVALMGLNVSGCFEPGSMNCAILSGKLAEHAAFSLLAL
jgi:hypothetical protein